MVKFYYKKTRKLSSKYHKWISNRTRNNKAFIYWPERSLEQLNSFQEILNKKNSEFELIMECLLIKLGLTRFTRNYPIANRFYADFYFSKQRIIIEVDDISHKARTWKDEARDNAIWSLNLGIRVYRFSTLAPYTDWEKDLVDIFKNNNCKVKSIKSHPRRFYKSNSEPKTKELEHLEIKQYDFEYRQWRLRLDNARRMKIEFKLKPPIKPNCLKRLDKQIELERIVEDLSGGM